MLRQALAMSLGESQQSTPEDSAATKQTSRNEDPVDFANMTEEEQIAYAMQISMQGKKLVKLPKFQTFFL